MTNFRVGDLIRATQDSEWSWGDKFNKGDQFFVGHPNTLHYFKFIKNEDEYFEKVDVETYGRHHTDYSSTWGHSAQYCVCWLRKSPMPKSYDDYHGKHRYEDHNLHRIRFYGDSKWWIS